MVILDHMMEYTVQVNINDVLLDCQEGQLLGRVKTRCNCYLADNFTELSWWLS